MYTIDNIMYTNGGSLMLSYIISSSAKIKILKVFIMNPENRYYVRQISKLAGTPIQAVQRETFKLLNAGFLNREKDGNRVYFKANKKFFLFQELKNIILKTVGIGDKIKEALAGKKEIIFCFIYGSYAKNEENTKSDIDLAVIGNIASKKVVELTSKLQDELDREINPYVISKDEFVKKLTGNEHFISSLIKTPKIFIKGTENDFRKFIESR